MYRARVEEKEPFCGFHVSGSTKGLDRSLSYIEHWQDNISSFSGNIAGLCTRLIGNIKPEDVKGLRIVVLSASLTLSVPPPLALFPPLLSSLL